MVQLKKPAGMIVYNQKSSIVWRSNYTHGILYTTKSGSSKNKKGGSEIEIHGSYRTYLWLTDVSGCLLKREDGSWRYQPSQDLMYTIHALDINYTHDIGDMVDDMSDDVNVSNNAFDWAITATSPARLITDLPSYYKNDRSCIDMIPGSPLIDDNYWVKKFDDNNYLLLRSGVLQPIVDELVYVHAYGLQQGVEFTDADDYT